MNQDTFALIVNNNNGAAAVPARVPRLWQTSEEVRYTSTVAMLRVLVDAQRERRRRPRHDLLPRNRVRCQRVRAGHWQLRHSQRKRCDTPQRLRSCDWWMPSKNANRRPRHDPSNRPTTATHFCQPFPFLVGVRKFKLFSCPIVQQ